MANEETPSDAFFQFATQAISGCIMGPSKAGHEFNPNASMVMLGVYLNQIYADIIHDRADAPTISWFRERMGGHSPVCILNIVFAAGTTFYSTISKTPPVVKDDPVAEAFLREFLNFQIRKGLVETTPRPLEHACTGPKWDAMHEITDDVLFFTEDADGKRTSLTREGLSKK
jgi:hypothetical protein